MNALADHQLSLGYFNLRANEEPLPYPGEDAPEEVLKSWKKDRRDQENRNASLRGRRYRTLEVVMMMNKFVNEDRFYIPWSYDWRGRVYPIPSFMSPQDTDMEKSLYLFYTARPVTVDAER